MTQPPAIKRKLTTILAADAANFSGRMAQDEVATVQALRKSRAIFETSIANRGGRIANTAGDGLIAEFPSVVEAVAAAITIQRHLCAAENLLPFRIGLHLGDVIVEGPDLLGDGVNLAARLQEAAPEGGIFVSRQVVDQAKGRLEAEFRPLGPALPKNFTEEVAIYAVLADGIKSPSDLAAVRPNRAVPSLEQDAHAKFKRTKWRAGLGGGGLFLIDLVNGAGPSWPAFGIAAIAISVFVKWRKLPPK
ncbi:MAG: adenylate/guanylate cyclase domain-containing protein [Ascidiaceihabitans sp.]|nr:adenylate/guanylate cyclase domain-containing protein [Ascidiaceihabitans sp.]